MIIDFLFAAGVSLATKRPEGASEMVDDMDETL